jgi:predicted TIM-barrel fold metal-dependent hydrolase
VTELVDAHLHVVSADRSNYPLRPSGAGRDWWTGRPVDATAVLGALAAAGIPRGVIVQAVGPYGTDSSYARAVVAGHPAALALVVAVDASGPDPAAEVAALVDAGPVAGVRVFAVGDEVAWLADGRADAIWSVADEHGVTMVVAVLAPQLDALAAVVGRHPRVPVALDHGAFPDLTGGPPYPRAASLFALAAQPPVHVKLSTHGLHAARRSSPDGHVTFTNTLVERFGAHRIAWGSDHPQLFETPYPEMVALGRDACRDLSDADRRALLGGTAGRLFFGAPAPR